MLEFLNGLDAEAYAGIAGFLAAVGTAIAAIVMGLRRKEDERPKESVAHKALSELGHVHGKIDTIAKAVDEIERKAETMHTNISIILDRLSGRK